MKQYNIELAKALQYLEEDSGRVRFVGGGWRDLYLGGGEAHGAILPLPH